MRVRQNALAGPKRNNRMLQRNALHRLHAVFVTPLQMGHGLFGLAEVALDVTLVKRVVDGAIAGAFGTEIVMAEGYVQAGVADVLWVERDARDMPLINCLQNLCI